MEYQGVLKKMLTENSETIQYYMELETNFINVNQLLNSTLSIYFVNRVFLKHLAQEIGL